MLTITGVVVFFRFPIQSERSRLSHWDQASRSAGCACAGVVCSAADTYIAASSVHHDDAVAASVWAGC